jgi:hypothetical protein
MLLESQRWDKLFARHSFWPHSKLSSILIDLFSIEKTKEVTKDRASSSDAGLYAQDDFRFFVASEAKRSERSGRFSQVLLVHVIDEQGKIAPMKESVVELVITALSRSLRESDYMGWYRDGHIIGAVLTGLAQESVDLVFAQLKSRLVETLGVGLGTEEVSRLQIEISQLHESQGM